MKISNCAQTIQPSKIRKMFNKALKYENVISFTLGEPDFTAAENVVQAGCRAIEEGKTKYSANAGILSLRSAIAAQLYEAYGLTYLPETDITITTGAMGALYLGLKAILNPGDEVILLEPHWTNYVQQILMSEGVPVAVTCREENDFIVDIQDLKQAITPRTRAILLNSPCNPTGSVLDAATLAEIAVLISENDLLVLADEVYQKILFEDDPYRSIVTMPEMQARTLVVNSFSKGYAMTGWRVGYAAGPAEWVSQITKLQENVAACAAMPAQYAALAALTGPQEFCREMTRSYRQRRDYIVDAVNRIPGMCCNAPRGTFYVFINISDLGMDSETFAETLLECKQVVVVPGTAFGPSGEGYIRLSCATSMAEIREGMERIAVFAQEHCGARMENDHEC